MYAVIFVALVLGVSVGFGIGSAPRVVTSTHALQDLQQLEKKDISTALASSSQSDMSSVCARGQLADTVSCVPIPSAASVVTMPALESVQSMHRDRYGTWQVYEQIPRRPDRPADYRAYQYPTEPMGELVGTYDLDRDDASQRRGAGFAHTGHGGVDLKLPRGTIVRLLRLVSQRGDGRVVFVGQLFGLTVVTKHTLIEGGRARDYLLIHGHLDRYGPKLTSEKTPAQPLEQGTILGYVGDSGSPGQVHLHLEVRQLRDGVNIEQLGGKRLTDRSVSIACDPRNVLPVKAP